MRPSAPAIARTSLRPLVAASALTLLAGLAQAAETAPAGFQVAAPLRTATRAAPAAAAMPADALLKRLPAGMAELTLRGETATRSFKVLFGRNEAARITSFQMALLNAVSVLPDRSSVTVTVNGTVLGTVPAAAADKAALVSLKVPNGLIVPGVNTVRLSAALSHRVDCSIPATYELWAALDPVQTGFPLPREIAMAGRTVDDLALEPLAADGTTRIHLRMAEGAEAADIGRAGRLVAALARRAGLQRPIVDVGPDLGTGAGFDLAVLPAPAAEAMAAGLKTIGRAEGVAIGRDPATGRLVVVMTATDGADLDRTLAGLARGGGDPRAGGVASEGFRRSFADLGLATDSFTGRHYTSTIGVTLPADFLASNDRARLLIDGGHAGSLVEGSELVFRVNGTLVSSMPLAAGRAERFQHAVVELPLRFFHPGHNDLSIEGMTSAVSDRQCNVITMPREARLTIAGTSEFDFPDFAHLAALPQLPAVLADAAANGDGTVDLYLTDADRGSIGAGLTVLANMAAGQGPIGVPAVHLGGPSEGDAPGIVIAPTDQLPERLAGVLRRIAAPAADQPTPPPAAPAALDAAGAAMPEPAPLATTASDGVAPRLDTAVASADALLRSRGFFFPGTGTGDLLPATPSTMIVAAVPAQALTPSIGGIELPRFTRDAAQWLVITAPDAATYQGGLDRLVAGGRWAALGGEAVSFDVADDTLHTLQPRAISYLVPSRFVLSDVRPILGGIMSDNILVSVALLLALMSILGVSTHALIRRMGVK